MHWQDGHFGVYFMSSEATREITTNVTLEWIHKYLVMRAHTRFYFLYDIINPQLMIKWWSWHINPMSHMLSLCSADDVTNQLLLISQALRDTMFVMCTCKRLYINFIHGHIHGWSCENTCYPCERNMGCIFVTSNLLYILHFSLPCWRQHYITLNYITMELNMCNAMSMAAHPPIKDACMIPHGFYCELHTNNSSSIIHRTDVDTKLFPFFTWLWHINATLRWFKQNF